MAKNTIPRPPQKVPYYPPLVLKVITIKTKVTLVSRGPWFYIRWDGKNHGSVDGQKKGMWLPSRRKAIKAFKANFKKWKI